MNLIASVQGFAAVRVSFEEVSPPSNPPLLGIISGIGSFFDFAIKPPRETIGTGTPLVFQSGRFRDMDKEIGINQLLVLPDGDIVASANTDVAEQALNILIDYLNREFGYRMEGASAKRLYVSTVVVEFEKDFESMIPQIGTIQSLLSRILSHAEPYKLIRISCSPGTGGMPNLPPLNPLDNLERTDFTIERRVGSHFSANRFFCTAPMRTGDHVRLLEEIERLLTGQKATSIDPTTH
jgi:hypothetical protein